MSKVIVNEYFKIQTYLGKIILGVILWEISEFYGMFPLKLPTFYDEIWNSYLSSKLIIIDAVDSHYARDL